jgi:hypothetical protein
MLNPLCTVDWASPHIWERCNGALLIGYRSFAINVARRLRKKTSSRSGRRGGVPIAVTVDRSTSTVHVLPFTFDVYVDGADY